MLRIAIAAALSGSLLAMAQVPVLAQPAAVHALASLGWLHGEWHGKVDFIGRPATGHLIVRPALNSSATELVYTAVIAASGDKPAFRFEGRGTYRVRPDGSVTGVWADSFGNFHKLKGRAKDGELRVNWGDAMSEVGHSSYVLGQDGTLTVTDSAFVQGKVQIFGTSAYRKEN
jgi:hypothetical protein